jgi:hypothetical protein
VQIGEKVSKLLYVIEKSHLFHNQLSHGTNLIENIIGISARLAMHSRPF